ncbi:MAG TPA: Swt1 family HEPN domain-containing protein [Nitrososphaera sp.]|jgi:hypothetical protein|nr:Swt1 family HEPN domain-containing protein [Nitrososphaera sp.]
MDVTQALKDTENSLRDFIANVMRNKFGDEWVEKCGVSADRIKQWQDRKLVEEKRQEGGVVEERLIYYADFYDLKTILEKHWSGEFSDALGDLKTMRVWLSELERLRDPDAHRRELLPHQKHLALGISGEIRTRLIRYRSKQETSEDYFPRIESVRDSLGNIWTFGSGSSLGLMTDTRLRVGDMVDFVITASDPLGAILQFSVGVNQCDWSTWQEDNTLSVSIADFHIGKGVQIVLAVRSPRQFHAKPYGYDDTVTFFYDVLPRRAGAA